MSSNNPFEDDNTSENNENLLMDFQQLNAQNRVADEYESQPQTSGNDTEQTNVNETMQSPRERSGNEKKGKQLNLDILSPREQAAQNDTQNQSPDSWDGDGPTSPRKATSPQNAVDSDDSDTDSENLFNVDGLLSRRQQQSKKISPFLQQIREKIQQTEGYENQYEKLFDDKDKEIDVEAVQLEDVDEQKIADDEEQQNQLDEELMDQFKRDQNAEENLLELRHFERGARENKAINRVRKHAMMLKRKEIRKSKHRRRLYRELSDSARHFFKKKEDLIKMRLEKMKAYMKPSQAQMEVHKKQWTLEWDKEPQLLDVRMSQLRSVKDTLPEGKYVMLVSLWNRLGGYPLQFSKHVTKVKKSTSEIYHGGQFDDVSMVFDEVIRTSGPSASQITPRMVFVFELLCLSRGTGGQLVNVNKTVAWGVFPAVDNNLKLVQGCFKCPMIKGDIDLSIDKHSQVQRIVRKNIKYWLGNFYFEVKHSGVDQVIRKPEEYVLEVLHEDDGDEQDLNASLSAMNLKKEALKKRGGLSNLKKKLQVKGNRLGYAEDYFRSKNDHKQVLTMEQPKIWFGSPQFSVLTEVEKEPLVETEDDVTMTEVVTEDDPNLSDEDLLEPETEKKPLLMQPASKHFASSMRGAFGPGDSQGSRKSMRMKFARQSRSGTANRGRTSRMTGVRSRPMTGTSSRPWTGANSTYTANPADSSFTGSRPPTGMENDVFGQDDELFMFDGEDFSSGSEQANSRPVTGLTMNSEPNQNQGPAAQEETQEIASITETERTEGDEYADNFYGQYEDETGVKTVKDVQKVYNSLFAGLFELGGASRMDLNFYKQSVKRKKHTWGGTPIYLEKLLYLRRSILIDMGLSHWKTLEFFLMLLFIFLIVVLRAYPHYLGHWIYLSMLRIPIDTSDQSNFYHIAYSFRGEFRNSATNFGYVVSGLLFNMIVSAAMFVFTGVAQLLYSGLPTMVYRFVFTFGFSVLLDPFLVAIVGGIFEDMSTDVLRLADYFLITERSTVPGVLITIILIIPLVIIQAVILYQYTLRIHMNRRVLDVYRRLHSPESSLFLPHDLEMTSNEFKTTCQKSKKWRGPDGHTRLVIVTNIPLDRTDYLMLKRLDILLSCKKWPTDYFKQVIENELDMHSSNHNSHIPLEVLSSKSRPAVFLKKNQFGKMFSIINFPVLADAILFDAFTKKDQRWRLLRMERLLVEYRIVGRMLINRLREGKVITGQLISPELAKSDYDIFSTRDVEVVPPEKKDIPTTGIKSIPYKLMHQFGKAKEYVKSTVYNALHRNEEDTFYGDMEMSEIPGGLDEGQKIDETVVDLDYRTVCKHVQIYNVSLTREKTLYRHFIRCPNGSMCEVFDKVENQESCSIADIHTNDYWIRKARIDAERRAKRMAKGDDNSSRGASTMNM